MTAKMKINLQFAGAGGQGVILSSVLLAKAYGIGEEMNISQTQSYGPEARGGACKAEVVVSDESIDYMKVDKADVFIAYNQIGYDKYCKKSKKDAIVIVNSTLVESDNKKAYEIPTTEMAEELGNPIVANMIMLGAVTKLLPKLHYETMLDEIINEMPDSAQELNRIAFNKGYTEMEKIIRQRGENAPAQSLS